MHHDMFDLIGLILKLPPKAPVPTYRHSIHLHSKRCRIALGRTWQKLLQRYPFLASTRIRLPWFLPTCCALGQHNSPRTHNAVQYHQYPKKHSCKEVQIRFQAQLIFSLSSQLFWWQNIPVQWHAGAPARRHSRPYLAQLLEICLLR